MNNKNLISGFGSGKDGGGSPTEDPNDLVSTQYAQIVDLICEGEIEGLVNGKQSIYIDKTPLQNSDLSYNFQEVSTDWRYGTQAQLPLPGNDSVRSEVSVNVLIQQATPIVRQITDTEIDSVNVTISTPRMTVQNVSTGDLSGSTVDYTIEVQSNGGGYVLAANVNITGKTISNYKRSTNVILSGASPYDIRVTRITQDSPNSSTNNDIYFSSYTKIIDTKLSYPNSALIGIRIGAKQFSSIPSRGYEVKLLKIKIPSNYDPLTRVYTGNWNGTFIVAWSDNPAWCFYDLITNDRYGLGKFIDTTLTDKWGLYQIGQYCDELVPSGFLDTGQSPILEPRFVCNLYLQKREEAFKVIRNMASIFRAMVFWSSNSVSVIQDKPEQVFAQFTDASVINGSFNYEGSSSRVRRTTATITWNDPKDAYKQKLEYVEDVNGISKFGINELQTVAIGCTSRGQAHRLGKWLLYSENIETEVVNFKVGLEGTQLSPGVIIRTIDSNRAGARYGGRVNTILGTSITLDNPITIELDIVYTISFVLPDGSIVDKTITNTGPVTTADIIIDSVFTIEPIVNSIWVVSSINLSPEEWRVISIKEEGENIYNISALEYNSSKYAFVEDNLSLEVKSSTLWNSVAVPVTNIKYEESLYELSFRTFGTRIHLSWDSLESNNRFQLRWRKDNDNYEFIETTDNNIIISNVGYGNFDFRVIAFNVIGAASTPTEILNQQILGKTALPENVKFFSVYGNNSDTIFKWDLVTDLDVDGYEIRYVKKDSGIAWIDADRLLTVNYTLDLSNYNVPNGDWTFMIKAFDTSGNYSQNETIFDLFVNNNYDLITNTTYEREWSGTLTNIVETFNNKLIANGTVIVNLEGWETFNEFNPNPVPFAYYEIPSEISYGFDGTVRVFSDITAYIPPTSSGNLRSMLQIDHRKLLVVYDGFKDWSIGETQASAIKARIEIDTSISMPAITNFKLTVDAIEFSQLKKGVIVGNTGLTVVFDIEFHLIPFLQIFTQNLSSLVPLRSSLNTTSFTVHIFDSSGTEVGGIIDWKATGV